MCNKFSIFSYIYKIYIFCYTRKYHCGYCRRIADIAVIAVIGLYPSIPHPAGLVELRETLDKRNTQKAHTVKLVKMAEFVLKSDSKVSIFCIV